MIKTDPFHPEWLIPPGAVIERTMRKKSFGLDEFAREVGLATARAKDLLEGSLAIDPPIALQLSKVLGSSQAFWLACQVNFDGDCEANADSFLNKDAQEWCNKLPLKEMIKLGWVQAHLDRKNQTRECMRFFGIYDIQTWKERYRKILDEANYRTSQTFSSDPFSTAVWLRFAEQSAEKICCEPFDRVGLLKSIPELRILSRIHDPRRFIPMLKTICSNSGVALVIVPTPAGCKASGATFFSRPGRATVVLSFRHFVDDHFWFTFFHELGHLVLHGSSRIFIENGEAEKDQQEDEANCFAREALIPSRYEDQMFGLPQRYDSYMRFALKLKIAPGIVVGQMQYASKLPYERMNKVKRRYDWASMLREKVIP